MVTNIDAHRDVYGMSDGSKFGTWYMVTFRPFYVSEYMPVYRLWFSEETRTPYVIRKLVNLEDELIPMTRTLYAMLKGNMLVQDEDLEVMHLPIRARKKSHRSPVADMPPAFYVEVLTSHRLKIYYYPEGSARRRGKLRGQHGVEVKWDFYDGTVESPEDLIHSLFDTASPLTVTFDAADHGRRIGIALRWENNLGEKGPWSIIQSAFVP
jgi:hypothetical protein